MDETKRSPVFRILIVISFAAMLASNALATFAGINGQTTAEVSDAYPNLFAPAGITFSIWSVIYTLLLAYVIYQLVFFSKSRDSDSYISMVKVGVVFIISSLINTAWIFTWHFEQLLVSVVLIFALLLCLILISLFLRGKKLSFAEKILIRLPFSIYYGWITVASVANVTTYLTSLQWSGFGLTEELWTIIMIVAGTLIAFATVLFSKDPVYGLTIVWAFAGIVMKHLDPEGHDRQFMAIIVVACICIAVILLESIVIAIFGKLPAGKKKEPEPAPVSEPVASAESDSVAPEV